MVRHGPPVFLVADVSLQHLAATYRVVGMKVSELEERVTEFARNLLRPSAFVFFRRLEAIASRVELVASFCY